MRWMEQAAEEFGDPSEPVTQIFCKWVEPLIDFCGQELAAGVMDGRTYVRIGPGAHIEMRIESGHAGEIDKEGMPRYGATPIAQGLWALSPSLYIPGMVHAFVVLYDVPIAVPWEKKIVPAWSLFNTHRPRIVPR